MHRLLVAITALLLMSPQSLAESLPLSTPEAQGFDSGKLAAVVLAAKESGQPVHSLLVVRRGNVVLDTDFYPYDGSLHDVASVTKSVTTSLIGIAAGEGLLDLDAPMLSFLPGRSIANRDERKERITVRQLTQNLSGLACVGYPEEVTLGQMAASVDFVQFTLDLPMSHEPGKHFAYCSPGMHLLTAVLQQATGRTALDFAKEKLFAPLGITDIAWDNDPQGITRGWGDLHLIPGDMAKLGLLWLQDGDWQGQSVIPSDWLSAATTQADWLARNRSRIPAVVAGSQPDALRIVPLVVVNQSSGASFRHADCVVVDASYLELNLSTGTYRSGAAKEFQGDGRTAFSYHTFYRDALGAETGIPTIFEHHPGLAPFLASVRWDLIPMPLGDGSQLLMAGASMDLDKYAAALPDPMALLAQVSE